jgi:hypothetical protein
MKPPAWSQQLVAEVRDCIMYGAYAHCLNVCSQLTDAHTAHTYYSTTVFCTTAVELLAL